MDALSRRGRGLIRHIVILVPQFPPDQAGGAELQAQGWAERLGAQHRVTVITGCAPETPRGRETRDGYRIVRVKPWLGVRGFASALRDVTRQIGAMEPRPDLLVCFMTYTTGLLGVAAGARLGIPAVVWIRGEDEYRSLRTSRIQRLIAPRVWQRAAAVLVQSDTCAADLLASLERFAPRRLPAVAARLDVIGNGVVMPEFRPRSTDGPVLSVGRLVPEKGTDVVIAACATAGRSLVIAGRGPERSALQNQAAALGADVRFTGFVGRDELSALYREASVVVLASWREGLPNVVLEAMAFGRPVIATPVGGVPDLIHDGVNGLLVPAGDPAALAAALDRLAADPATAERIATAGRATAERNSWQRVQSRFESALPDWIAAGRAEVTSRRHPGALRYRSGRE